MPMYNLREYSDIYLKRSEILLEYQRDEPALCNNRNIIDFPADNNNSTSFKFKQQKTGQTENGGTKNVEIIVPLKYLSNIWRTLEMPLINCDNSLHLKWSKKCIIVSETANNQNPIFQVNDTKLYHPVATLSTQETYNSLNNQNLVLKEQLIGISIQLQRKIKHKTDIQIL